MARRHSSRRHLPAPTPEPTVSAMCLVNRHARCKGALVTLAQLGECTCDCHAAALPAPFADQVAAFPPCDRDAAETVA